MKTEVYKDQPKTGNETGRAIRPQSGEKSSSGKPQGDQAEMMKKMQEAGTPGPAHKALNALAGNWKAEVKCWMEQGAEPKVSQGTAKVNWILNGHYLQEDFQGEMMGRPFNGRWVIGYDNIKQKYTSCWVDDAGTSMVTSEGKGENDNKVITLEGKSSCPATGRTDLPMKQVFRVQGADKRTVEMYVEGKKNMEITYTRQ